jgi:hypothetical protein
VASFIGSLFSGANHTIPGTAFPGRGKSRYDALRRLCASGLAVATAVDELGPLAKELSPEIQKQLEAIKVAPEEIKAQARGE